MPALNRAADTSTLWTWPTRLALKLGLGLHLAQTIDHIPAAAITLSLSFCLNSSRGKHI